MSSLNLWHAYLDSVPQHSPMANWQKLTSTMFTHQWSNDLLVKDDLEWLITSLCSWMPQEKPFMYPAASPWARFMGSDGWRGKMVHQGQQFYLGWTEVCWGRGYFKHQDHMGRVTLDRNISPESWTGSSDQGIRAEKRQEIQMTEVPLLLLISMGLFVYREPSNNRRKKETPNSEGNKIAECVTLETWSPCPWLP